jgi:hypothetical protein
MALPLRCAGTKDVRVCLFSICIGSEKQCASSKVAITGDVNRRPSWHWQAVAMLMSDGSYNRLTLGSAQPDAAIILRRDYQSTDFCESR